MGDVLRILVRFKITGHSIVYTVNKDLAYQREYRLVIAHELPIDHFVRIGKLDNTKILETEEMREFKFSIGYISHQIGEEMI